MRDRHLLLDRAKTFLDAPVLHAGSVSTAGQPGLQGSTFEPDYESAYQEFVEIVGMRELDKRAQADDSLTRAFEATLQAALGKAYLNPQGNADVANQFLQRVLYRINRLKLFWYDDLENYENERSNYLRSVRDRIEACWQPWELDKHHTGALKAEDVSAALCERAAADVNPPISESSKFFRDAVCEPGYLRLLEIASLDALVEASQLSRTLGGVSNEVHAMLTRVLLEEYGNGRLPRKHSSYFAVMLTELGMDTAPEAYFDRVPWQVLAAINHSFLLSERKRHFLRYIGGLLYTEISVPAGFSAYRAAAERLGFTGKAMAYWDLHIKEDERHGRWMLNDVALPLARLYPQHAWELVLGYDQQRLFSERASGAVAHASYEADRITQAYS